MTPKIFSIIPPKNERIRPLKRNHFNGKIIFQPCPYDLSVVMSWCIFFRNSRSLAAVFGYPGIFVSFWSTNDSWLPGSLGQRLGRSGSQIGGALACRQSKILHYVVDSNISKDGMMGWKSFQMVVEGNHKIGVCNTVDGRNPAFTSWGW